MSSHGKAELSLALLDLGPQFRGGQRQTLNLALGLKARGLPVLLAGVENGELLRRGEASDLATFGLRPARLVPARSALRLARRLKTAGTTIIHASDSRSHTFGLLVKRLMPKLHLIVTVRARLHRSSALSRIFKYRARGVERYVAISQAVAAHLEAKGVPRGKISIIPSAVDRECFHSRGRPEREELVIGTACALESSKGVHTLLEALVRAAPELGAWRVLIAGVGPEREALEHLAASAGLGNKVSFSGFVEKMGDFYRSVDIFVLASTSEGLGSALLEAGACGAVLVASDVDGIREVISAGRDGRLFAAGDSAALAEILRDLGRNRAARERLKMAFDKRLPAFDIDNMVETYVRVYREVLNG